MILKDRAGLHLTLSILHRLTTEFVLLRSWIQQKFACTRGILPVSSTQQVNMTKMIADFYYVGQVTGVVAKHE